MGRGRCDGCLKSTGQDACEVESGRVQGRCVMAGQVCEKVHKRCQAS